MHGCNLHPNSLHPQYSHILEKGSDYFPIKEYQDSNAVDYPKDKLGCKCLGFLFSESIKYLVSIKDFHQKTLPRVSFFLKEMTTIKKASLAAINPLKKMIHQPDSFNDWSVII